MLFNFIRVSGSPFQSGLEIINTPLFIHAVYIMYYISMQISVTIGGIWIQHNESYRFPIKISLRTAVDFSHFFVFYFEVIWYKISYFGSFFKKTILKLLHHSRLFKNLWLSWKYYNVILFKNLFTTQYSVLCGYFF